MTAHNVNSMVIHGNLICQLTRTGNTLKVTRITGSQDNFLGIVLGNKKVSVNQIEIKEIDLNDSRAVEYSNDATKQEILKQVLEGLIEINNKMGTDFHIKQILFVKDEDKSENIYKNLVMALIQRYASNGVFTESNGIE